MPQTDFPYGHEVYISRQSHAFCGADAGGAATTTYCRTPMFTQGKLRNVIAVVTTIGTVSGHGFDILVGTASVGTLNIGTASVGSTFTSGDCNTAVPAGQVISLKSKADTAGKALAAFEWQFTPFATFSTP
jgi:hypothetical protein